MAEQDASVAIQNAIQKIDQQPNLLHNVEKLKSVKSKLHRYGSRLDKLNFSISELTKVREFAYAVEDVMDDAIMVSLSAREAAQKRWRLLKNLLIFFPQSGKISQQHVEEQIEKIDNSTTSIDRSTCNDEVDYVDDDVGVVEDQDISQIRPQENLFYLSLSGFPAEVEILARRLIQIWMAEGFLDQRGGVAMEEQGREQIEWLLERGFITQAERGTSGNLKTFKIGEEKLQACRSAAEKENFLHVKIINRGQIEDFSEHTTRLALHNQTTNDPFTGTDQRTFANLSKVRSLHIHCDASTASDSWFLKPQKKQFRSVTVLDLGSLKLETIPEVIGKLVHLKYLRLSASKATKIHASICNLPNLQTIDLKETKSVKTIPVEIWKMKKNLRHLHLGGATALPPPHRSNHFVALQSLTTLSGVRPDKELKRLMVRAKFPNLNRLRLQTKKKDSQEEFLSVLNSLDHLYHLRSLTLGGPIGDLPNDWNAFPSSLTKMTLSKTRIPVSNCVKTLQNVPNLRYLKLMEESVTGTEMECDGGGFPALQVLRMVGIKELTGWKVEKGAMRLLGDLEMKDCQELRNVEAIQPSIVLRETLRELQRNHPELKLSFD